MGPEPKESSRSAGHGPALAALAIVAALALLPVGAEGRSTAVVGPMQAWVTDGDVLAVTSVGGATYVGGDFTLIGRSTGSWAEIDGGGAVRPIRGVVRGSVSDAVSDGRGGWFLQGDVSAVGGVEVADGQLVHLRASGRLDPRWRVRTDGTIDAIARVRDRLYVGGSFDELDGATRANLAALDVRTGELLDWRPRVSGQTQDDLAEVYAIEPAPDGETVYVGGDFGRINGTARRSLAAIGADGKLLPFDPGVRLTDAEEPEEDVTATVWTLALDPNGRVVYIAGEFEVLGGRQRPGLGAVDARTGRTRPWNPDCDGDVSAMVVGPAGSAVYVAGSFASIGGKSRRGLAAVDAKLGTATPWDPGVGGEVQAIALDSRRHVVYAGGSFEAVADVDRANLAAVDMRTGNATGWDVPVVGDVGVVARTGSGTVVVGGDFVSVGALRRAGLASLTADGCAVTDWRPALRGIVRALASDPQHGRVYVGGRFSLGESRTQRSLATVDLAGGAVVPWGPTVNSGVWAIAPAGDGETVYLGGAFTTVDGKARRRLAALRASDGTLLPWASGASAVVRSLSLAAEELWVGGQFTTIGGEPRRGVASVELSTGRATGWDAASNGNVEAVVHVGELVYVAGPFTSIGGRSRKHLAALDIAAGAASRWDPAPDDVVRAMALAPDGTQLVVGGDFERVGGGRRDVGAFDLGTGFVTDWRPVAPFSGLALAFGESGTLFVAGEGELLVFWWPPPVL
jgi:hypothetical protein